MHLLVFYKDIEYTYCSMCYVWRMPLTYEDRTLWMSINVYLKVKRFEVQLYKLQILTLMPVIDAFK
jgi:hypothetical protein